MERPGTGKGFCGTKKQQQSAAVPRIIDGPAFGTEILLPLLVLGRIVAELENSNNPPQCPEELKALHLGQKFFCHYWYWGGLLRNWKTATIRRSAQKN